MNFRYVLQIVGFAGAALAIATVDSCRTIRHVANEMSEADLVAFFRPAHLAAEPVDQGKDWTDYARKNFYRVSELARLEWTACTCTCRC